MPGYAPMRDAPVLALALSLSVLCKGGLAVNHTLSYLPFSWDIIPRYTFCSNSSVTGDVDTNPGLFNNESAQLTTTAAHHATAAASV
jgi:hypothetical protein